MSFMIMDFIITGRGAKMAEIDILADKKNNPEQAMKAASYTQLLTISGSV